jgi:hypothetical protein
MGVMDCLLEANRGELSHRSVKVAISRDRCGTLTACARAPTHWLHWQGQGFAGLRQVLDTASTRCGSSWRRPLHAVVWLAANSSHLTAIGKMMESSDRSLLGPGHDVPWISADML